MHRVAADGRSRVGWRRATGLRAGRRGMLRARARDLPPPVAVADGARVRAGKSPRGAALARPAAELTETGPSAWPAAGTLLERLTAAGMLGWAAPSDAGVPRRLVVPHVQGIKMTDPLGLSEASAGQETRAGAPDVTVLATDSYLRVPRLVSQVPGRPVGDPARPARPSLAESHDGRGTWPLPEMLPCRGEPS